MSLLDSIFRKAGDYPDDKAFITRARTVIANNPKYNPSVYPLHHLVIVVNLHSPSGVIQRSVSFEKEHIRTEDGSSCEWEYISISP